MTDFEAFLGMMDEYFKDNDGKITKDQFSNVIRAHAGMRPYFSNFFINQKDDFKLIERRLKAGYTRSEIAKQLVSVNGYSNATAYIRINAYLNQPKAEQRDLFA